MCSICAKLDALWEFSHTHGWRIVETRGGAFPLVAVQLKTKWWITAVLHRYKPNMNVKTTICLMDIGLKRCFIKFSFILRGCFWKWEGALPRSGGARAPSKPLILRPWSYLSLFWTKNVDIGQLSRRGSRISARGGRQGNDDLIMDGNERFLTYANTDLHLFKMFIAILCLNGVEQTFKRHQCPFFLPLRRGNPRLRRGSLRPRGGRPPQPPWIRAC